ncbi:MULTISPECIES: DUF998 domain-containing protein [Mycobacterium]|uniref:DUF998 domain-containing protein n=1 Tax=Mycobacterium kiyosense TaxID=2871094 RepID=A0A9P3Q4R1_9MYCO|nr:MULTISPECIES: DUF998 domain-containing protein [Mycobacterium]BDB39779.1 hypothetical protein IWGMT90018_02250 [Mycobacterium kiyosense]BDE11633.1 hypothetical protein MKCMC460_04930 [Mycobacterium sp. 20KCMC460]GLB81911.1 hypothetical protein SRL2020028_11670 [Mycobacterium kiyosense]GLB88129.1 hypothetical protein SRL2020130_09460 [Mycobacterium kiyosense]GLB95689.1 hypothetical protein SRL2020226_24650 [Mycobacterium kiyosense]
MLTVDPRHRHMTTAAMLGAGVPAGILVTATSCLLAALRPGFDVRHHANSLLVLGDWGWVQTLDFIVYGVLLVAFGIGIGRAVWPQRSGIIAAAGIAVYGLGAGVVVGFNAPTPAFGFPPGSTTGYPGYDTVDTSTKIHGIGGMIGFLAVTVACFAFARYFARTGRPGWSVLSGLVATAVLAVCAYLGASASAATDTFNYLPTWVVSVMLWLYVSAVAGRLLADFRGGRR